jgi:CubicO group peptidase (beta-lactamase class C family)
MNNPVMFLPLALYLVLILTGPACAAVGLIALRKSRVAGRHRDTPLAQPPLLAGTPNSSVTSPGARAFWLKGLVALGLGTLAVGVLGAWATRISVAYTRQRATEWSDGRAPRLEPVIRKHCAPFLNAGKTVGLAVAVVTPTSWTIMTFGHPALGARNQAGAGTLFEIGSITKTFTALVLAREIEQGHLRLDQPVQELLPPGVKLPEPARAITLRHLTTHSSGFPRMPARWSPLSGLGTLLFGTDPYAGYTEADLLADVSTVKLESKPGTHASYSNYGMMLLGYLLSAEAHSGYETLVKREVCLPLGLTNTTVSLQPGQAQHSAQGYRAILSWGPLIIALRSAPWLEGNPLGGAGAIRSSAADMLRYLQANMHPEGLPVQHALREVHKVLFEEDEHTAFCMNWIQSHSERLQQPMIWHNGGTGGFRSFLGFTADSRFGVLLLSNSTEAVDDLAINLLRDVARPATGRQRPKPQSP